MEIEGKMELVADLLEVEIDDVSPEMSLDTFEAWDSLATLSLLALLEENFAIDEVGGAELKNLKEVKDILELMK